MIDEAAQTLEASLDALLQLMHMADNADSFVQGYPKEAAGMKMYKTPNRYGSDGFTFDDEATALKAGETVSAIVSDMKDPHRTCLRIEARNLKTGVKVWTSARLPLCPVERSIIRQEARNQLARKLQAVGLL